jgi:hypothetical protein
MVNIYVEYPCFATELGVFRDLCIPVVSPVSYFVHAQSRCLNRWITPSQRVEVIPSYLLKKKVRLRFYYIRMEAEKSITVVFEMQLHVQYQRNYKSRLSSTLDWLNNEGNSERSPFCACVQL